MFPDSESSQPNRCSRGHSASCIIPTEQGGSICLLCLASLLTNSDSIPTVHLSFALSQLTQALSQPQFSHALLTFHSHLLVSPLVHAISVIDDEAIAKQVIEVVVSLCDGGGGEVAGEFVRRVSERIGSGALCWSRRQVFMLHCYGVLLNHQSINPHHYIKDKSSLVSNLIAGLEMPSEDMQGEILFILYSLYLKQGSKDDQEAYVLIAFCPKLWRISLEVLMKSENDDVRTNCIAFLTALAQRGILCEEANASFICSVNQYEGDNFLQAVADEAQESNLSILFADAVKGPLLSSDKQVQIGTLNLIFHYLSLEGTQTKQMHDLVEEHVADYVFEALRLSDNMDSLVSSCMLVLDLLSVPGQAFRQRLAVGFPTLIKALHYVADIPFHPVQSQTLKLILTSISDCPGIVSASQVDELVLILTRMLKMESNGEMGMLQETFILACLLIVALIRSQPEILNSSPSIHGLLKHTVLASLNDTQRSSSQLLHVLHLLKAAYSYSCEEHLIAESRSTELRNCILDLCTYNILPWFLTSINSIEEEEIVLGVLEIFHSIMLLDQHEQVNIFSKTLASSSWFSFSFGCLGLYPTDRMKCRVYVMLSSLVDILLGENSGEPIRDAASYLPVDPSDLLFLIGQKRSSSLELSSSQSAVLLILYTSSLFDDRLADGKLVLSSLEQYILVNCSNILYGVPDSSTIIQILGVYGLYRALAKQSYQVSYSAEAEKILFQLLTANEWDLSSASINLASLKWLFQQEKLRETLSHQILKICRTTSSSGTHVIVSRKNCHSIDVVTIGKLVATEDNYGAKILVCLLRDLLKEEGLDHDVILVINLMTSIIKVFAAASHQLCLHGIISAIQTLYDYSIYSSSPNIAIAVLELVYNILCSLNPETLCGEKACFLFVIKLMDCLIPSLDVVHVDKWTNESLLLLGVLSLILLNSSVQALVECSKCILLHTSLISAIDSSILGACLKGPALTEHDEDTNTGAALIFILLLNYFSLRSISDVLPETVDWQSILDPANSVSQICFISINCQDLCRLMHYGSPSVKLVASYSLLEVFTRIEEQRMEPHSLNRMAVCLMSVVPVLEGLVFYADTRVALNSCLCISMILGWEDMNFLETKLVRKNTWCRLIVEELSFSLAAPCVASNSFISLHRPAVYVAVALLKLQRIPEWMRPVFESCISGIIKHLDATGVRTETVLLFRELLNSNFLKAEQVTCLNRVLQVSMKNIYAEITEDESRYDPTEEANNQDDLGVICRRLIHLMVSDASLVMSESRSQSENMRLLEEIEMFSKALGGKET